ncbi:protein-disulfide reductase DsbD, partial [Photobacterium sanctipauli]
MTLLQRYRGLCGRLLNRFALLGLLLTSLPLLAFNLPGLSSSNQNQFVPVDEAFVFNFSQQGDRVYLDWQIKPDYYLYQHQLSVTTDTAELGHINIPNGMPYQDEFFGEVNIYTEPLTLSVPVLNATNSDTLTVRYQGCAKAGFCYPPEIRIVPLNAVAAGTDASVINASSSSAASNGNSENNNQNSAQSNASSVVSTNNKTAPSTALAATNSAPTSQQDKLAGDLAEQWWTPLVFLALGVGLAFTPCVLPMYPILSGIVLGNGQQTHGRTFRLAFTYVQGMALTYTLLGLVVASAGMQFQAALQHPYILIGLSVLFVLLAMSMFGAYTLQLPSSLQTWLNGLSNKQQGGNTGGVFSMGAISGLVCSPCTTAPLSGALIYVAQSGDLLTGAVALYALAIGMGIPLILAAMFGNKLLPKAGNWMNHVKVFFGFVLLAVPLFLLERILPPAWMPYLWSVLGIAAFGWLYHVKNTLAVSWRSSALAVLAIVGLFISVQPLYPLITGSSSPVAATSEQTVNVEFKRVTSIDDLDLALADAKASGKPVMLDFYADWCVACKEFEKYTFHDPAVAQQLQQFVLLQADVTNNTPTDFELLQQMDVL